MSYEQKDMSGVLFRNDKDGNEARPDYRGSVKVKGVEYDLAAWLKESRDGSKKYMSLSVKPKQDRKPAPAAQAPEADPGFGDGKDLPF